MKNQIIIAVSMAYFGCAIMHPMTSKSDEFVILKDQKTEEAEQKLRKFLSGCVPDEVLAKIVLFSKVEEWEVVLSKDESNQSKHIDEWLTSDQKADVVKILTMDCDGPIIHKIALNGNFAVLDMIDSKSGLSREQLKILVNQPMRSVAGDDCKDVNEGETPLHVAIRGGHKKLVEGLLVLGADPNIQAPGENIEHWFDKKADKQDNVMPLHRAAMLGDDEMVSLLIKHGATVDARTAHYQETPLHHAAAQKNKRIVEILIEAQADSRATTLTGRTVDSITEVISTPELEVREIPSSTSLPASPHDANATGRDANNSPRGFASLLFNSLKGLVSKKSQ